MKFRTRAEDPDSPMIDTDNLPDMDALITEKVMELRNLCYSAGYRCVLTVQQRYNATLRNAWCIHDLDDGESICDTVKSAMQERLK
jgi:hypothetical protein